MATPRKLAANFVATELDGEMLIVDMKGGELLSLEGAGAAIWRLIDGQRSMEAIIADLEAEYGPDPAIDADVRELVAELATAGLIAFD